MTHLLLSLSAFALGACAVIFWPRFTAWLAHRRTRSSWKKARRGAR